ncbi:MAG: PadR family transcriptional regulator [Candidatus Zixiibacteriota bacterium]
MSSFPAGRQIDYRVDRLIANAYNGDETMTLTQTDYIILAYLAGGPEHGYRLIERMKEDNLDAIVGFSVPNVYHALRKLHAQGAVGLKVKKNKSRPDQKIYSLNDLGRHVLEGFLEDDLIFGQQIRFRSDMIFPLADKIGIDGAGVKKAIEKRLESLSSDLLEIQDAWREAETAEQKSSPISEIAIRHRIRFLKNEIDFYKKTLKELK